MKAFVQRSVFVLLALLAARGDGLRGQWKIVGPELYSSDGYGFGAMHFRDGIIWAGINSLWSSTDTGNTWDKSSFTGTIINGTTINDINFFDKTTGIIGASDGVYLTSDGGQTWKNIMSGSPFIESVAFGSSASVIYACVSESDEIAISTNMGASWRTVGFGGIEASSLTIGKEGTIHVFSVGQDGPALLNGWINSSNDEGQTWSSNIGSVTGDDYTIIADSCDPNRLYLTNENWVVPSDSLSRIFMSTDAGASWIAGFTAPRGKVSGSISAASQAVYAGTWDGTGVLRSLNRGQSWTSIGGPVVQWDTRDIVAVNDNIVFCIGGSIWATFNSGGDSVSVSSLVTPTALFGNVSVECDSLASQALSFRTCDGILGIKSWSIAGSDSVSYNIATNSNNDTLSVTFLPMIAGNHQAVLIISLSDGTIDTVMLNGFSNGQNQLSLSTTDQKTDTLDASVAVPITITGLAHPENINLTLHYDTTLQYQGFFDAANVKLDIPGQQWPGRSKLNVASAQSGMIAGYARFTVFADSTAKPQVSFDSLDVLSASSPCEYALPVAVTSTITPPSGCGTIILSEFLKSGQIPTFSVRSNPTMGDIELTSSLDLGDAEVEIYDMLGVKRADLILTLAKDAPARISLPDEAGMYYLRIKSAAGISSMSVIVTK